MKRWLIECTDRRCATKQTLYAVYSRSEPLACYYCGMPVLVRGGFSKVRGVPVKAALERGIYQAPVM